MMQLLLFYCIVVQSCVLFDVEPTTTTTQSSTESKISRGTVGHANDDPRPTESSLFDPPVTLVKKAILSAKEIISIPSLIRIMKGSELVKNGETEDTANNEYVDFIRDNEIYRKGNDRVFRVIHKRDRSLEEEIGLKNFPAADDFDFRSSFVIPATSYFNYMEEVEDHYTLPKEKKPVAFENGKSTIRNKRYIDYIYTVTTNSRKNKRKSFKIKKTHTAPPKLT